MHHKISVVIPCYNAEGTIRESIDSVLKQSYPIFEIICVDDCSTDNSVNIIKKEYGGVLLIESVKNHGPAKSRNIGIDSANGDFIAFLDSDDVWYPNKISIQMEYMIQNDLVCIGSPFTINKISALNYNEYSFRLLSLHDLARSNKLPTPSVIIKKMKMKMMFNESMRYAEDYDFWLRLANFYPSRIGLIEQPLVSLSKPVFGVSGLSSHLWKMEKGELIALNNNLGRYKIIFLVLSVAKFIRRLLLVYFIKNSKW
ncbi:glycosyltransferase family 2 protein [Yersinia intermedia]|uniref:Putative glycosyltransferase n=1 Tax=Yersinia intermedia TaxID=631 RepID=A0A0T9M5I7_YERIN|nr:glycosyltransferase family 2 protein [Yersinia intermedia]MCB5297635.1 glycosyltransferase family 2 protein [Yersinia intermedia]CNF65082.1 putative glycosyltransferase [Yersinia intermedia]CNJ77398.1 putative glycosyltransferase [Yersinia intermedia]